MAQRSDPEDATFDSMRANMMARAARSDRTIDRLGPAQRLAYTNESAIHVQANPGDRVKNRVRDLKNTPIDLRSKANDLAGQNDSQVHVQSSYVIRSKGGRRVGVSTKQTAPMTADNMNSHYVQQRRREVEALVAERARRIK